MMHVHARARARYPRLDAYLSELPQGIESWPDHRAKASLVRAGLRVLMVDDALLVDAPPRLRDLVEKPPVDSAWITEVEYCAFSMMIADAHDLDAQGFGEFWYEVMTGLVTSRLYSVMLRFVSASTLLRTTAARWEAFHRGLELKAYATEQGLQLDFTFPKGMVPELCLEGYTQVWQALIDQSRSSEAEARLVSMDRTSARYLFDGFR